MQIDLEVPALVGQLIVGGFSGPGLSATFARELAQKRRGGAILFKRNLPSVPEAADLCAAILEAAPRDLPPFIGVDQEGGRVARLPPPALKLPPMRELASLGDLELVMAAARAVGTELAAIGFEGVLFSDDLEMKAITARWPIEEAAVEAVWAGCDALLVCSDEDAQGRVHEALTRAAEKDTRFRDRCAEAATRVLRLRRL